MTSTKPQKENKRQTIQAKFDRLWLENPRQFDPERNYMEKERLERTLELILRHLSLDGIKALDLGCGQGVFAKRLAAKGSFVDAVDISSNALKPLKSEKSDLIHPIQDLIPQTLLEDDAYDLVISTEIIGYLPQEERRLYFAELSRLIKPNGFVVCSTGLDIRTENPLGTFETFVDTEFQITEWVYSYHGFYIRIKDFFKRPESFIQGFKSKMVRQKEANQLSGFSSWWYRLNSSWLLGPFWLLVHGITYPIRYLLEHNRSLLIWLEKLCRLINPDGGLSHAIFIGQRRPLFPQEQELPPERTPNQRKRIWE